MKQCCYILSLIISVQLVIAQNVGINTTGTVPNASAMLDIASSTSGLLIPRMTSAQIIAISSPATGLLAFQTDGIRGFYYYDGTNWLPLFSYGTGWGLSGNLSTVAAANFIGTTDAVDFVVRTTNAERIRVTSGGNIGVGTASPQTKLDVRGSIIAANTDYVNGSTGSLLQIQQGATLGNTYSSIGAYKAGGTLFDNLILQVAGGNVGIGTSSPNYYQHGGTNKVLEIQNSGASTNDQSHLLLSSGSINPNSSIGTITWALPNSSASNKGMGYISALTGASSTSANPSMKMIFTTRNTTDIGWVERMRIAEDGNVGISNTSPTEKLDVAGNVKFSGALMPNNSAGTSGQLLVSAGSGASPTWSTASTVSSASAWQLTGNTGTTAGTNFIGTTDAVDFVFKTAGMEKMRLTSAGNIGIGTTAPLQKLHINLNNSEPIDIYTFTDPLPNTVYTGVGGVRFGWYGQNFSEIVLGRRGSSIDGSDLIFNTATDATTTTEKMRILYNGSVGIGTPAPVSKLSIQSAASSTAIIATNINNPYNYGVGMGTSAVGIRFNRTPNDAGSTGVMADIYGGNESETTSTMGYLAFNTRLGIPEVTTEKMRITSNGHVGIGVTTPNQTSTTNAKVLTIKPSTSDNKARIELIGTRTSNSETGMIAFLNNSESLTNTSISAVRNGSDDKADLFIDAYNVNFRTNLPLANAMTIQSSGNVGIGTTAPAAKLNVLGNAIFGQNTNNATDARIDLTSGGSNNSSILDFGFYNTFDAAIWQVGRWGSDGSFRISDYSPGPEQNRFYINTSGNVGIGTTSPVGKLAIVGGDANGSIPSLSIGGGVSSNNVNDLYILDSKNMNAGVGFAARVIGVNIQSQVDASNQVLQRTTWSGVTGAGALYIGTDDVSQGIFGVLGSPQGSSAGTVLGEYFTIRGNGNVGIGTTGPSYKLDVQGGDINASGSVRSAGVALTSDSRLKKNITNLGSGVDMIMKLHPVSYLKKETIEAKEYTRSEIGFIAQEVQKILPQLVSEGKDKDKLLAVDYNSIIPILTKAIQEQQKIIKQQQQQINDILKKLEK